MNDMSLIETPIGILEIHTVKDYLCKVQFMSETNQNRKIISRRMSLIEKQVSLELNEYFDGKRRSFTIPLKIDVPPFYKKVLLQVQKIEYGRTSSYAEIAKMSGNEKALRAVGTANSRNPLAIIIPCHRIISSKGTLGGYTGGLDKKSFLLRHEKINISQ